MVRLTDMPDNPTGYAAVLYARLHDLDGQGWDRILIELPPDTPEWAGVRDRLRRAAG
jgi:L-threonylcarbamoyladenylate synthase